MTKRKDNKSPKPAATDAARPQDLKDKARDTPVADSALVASDPENAKLADSLHANA